MEKLGNPALQKLSIRIYKRRLLQQQTRNYFLIGEFNFQVYSYIKIYIYAYKQTCTYYLYII